MSDSTTHKPCSICGVEFPTTTEYWHRNKNSKDGLMSLCKECNKAKVRRHKQEHPELERQWREENREHLRELGRESYYRRTGGQPHQPKQVDGQRYCLICQKWKPATLEYWYRNSGDPNGLSTNCAECSRAKGREDYYERTGGKPMPVRRDGDRKQCSECLEWKPGTIEFFASAANRADGLYPLCKACSNEKGREYARARGVQPKQITRTDDEKRCPTCEEWKPLTAEFFYPNRASLSGFAPYCKVCAKTYTHQMYLQNKDIRLAWNKEWAQRNSNKVRQIARITSQRRRSRERAVFVNYSQNDWQRALDYFGGCCAVCGRPPGLWHKMAMDHWIPISSLDCPGTIPLNIVPLCHGAGGCNNSKSNKDALSWLVDQFGEHKAKKILTRIEAYFERVRQQDQ